MIKQLNKIAIGIVDSVDRHLIIETLKSFGYEAITIKENEYQDSDLVIIDKAYANSIGKKVLEFKKTLEAFLPIIVVLDHRSSIDKYLLAGFDDYLQMPFTKTTLNARIKIFLRLREQSIIIQQRGEERYRAIFEATGTATLIVEADNTIVLANEECFPVTGYKPEELIGTSWINYVAPESLELMQHYHQLRRIDPTKAPRKYEVKLITKKGEKRDVILFANMIPGTTQSIVSMLDITERHQVEDALRQSEERMRTIIEGTKQLFFYTQDAEGNTTYVSPTVEQITGYSVDVWKNRPDWFTTNSEINEIAKAKTRAHLRGEVSKEPFLVEIKHKNGNIVLLEVYENPIFREGKVVGIQGVAQDITEKKLAEKLLSSTMQRYKHLTDIAPVGIFHTDNLGYTTYVNKKWCEISGLSCEEALGDGWLKAVHPEDREKLIAGWKKDIKSQKTSYAEYRFLRPDGSIAYVIGQATPEKDIENKIIGYTGTIVDITELRLAEMALKQSQQQLARLIGNLKGMVYNCLNDEKWTMKFISNGAIELTGYSPEELIDNKVIAYNDLIIPEDRNYVRNTIQEACNKRIPYELEYRIVTKYGLIKNVWEKGIAIFSEDGSVDHLEGFITDVTEKKLAEAQLLLQNAALEASANAIVIANREGFIQWANAAFTRLTGFKVPDEVFGKNPRDLVKSGKQDQRFYKNLWDTILSGKVWHGELINRRKDGSLYDEEMTITPVKNNEGTITHFIAVKQDITERKLRESELQREKNFVESITETSPVGITRVDKNGIIIYANTRAEEILGLTRSEIAGQKYNSPVFRISDFDGNEFPDDELPFHKVKTELKTFTGIRHAINTPDGRRVLLSINATPLFNEVGEFDGMVATFEDITEHIKAEQAIREREQWFRQLADTTATAIVIYQGERFVYVNKATEIITGYTAEELLSMHFWDIVHPEYRNLVRERGLSRQLGAEVPLRYEFKILRKDGKVLWIDYTAGKIDWFGQPAAIGTAVDITERKKAEEDLKKSYEQYEQFFTYDLTGDYISTVEGKIIACNPAFLKIFGFSSIEEALQIDTSILYESPEDRARLLSRLQREKKIEYYELQMRKLDGTPLHIVANVIGIFDENDKLVRMQGYLFDDTKRKSLENMLAQAQKLESLGTLASGIAHDFNNILAIILGHASLLKIHTQDPNKILQSVEAITRATERGTALVRQMLTFARKTEISIQPLDINVLIKEISKMINETFPKIIEINLNLKSNLPPVLADPTQIHQVLLNLCVNARDAMPEGGKLTISTEISDIYKLKEHFSNINEPSYVTIIVSDTGIGMDEDTKARIFEPFFTTKAHGQGTGLGLSVVHGIVSAHKGFIRVESEPGQGTTFYVYLPSMETHKSDKISASETEEEIKGGNETILIIEDEQYLRQMLEELLIAKGYTVITAENGVEGVDVYTKNYQNIDLIITDMGLPKLDGKEVFYRIHKINPDAKVIIASGYLEPSLKSQLYKDGLKDFITKPYSLSEILKKIRTVLDFR